jgi:1-deoxy-D-xylulose 5-phosphate reductoisomerase
LKTSVQDSTRVNRAIRAREVRLIGADGQQLGIMLTRDALAIAEEQELDLVEVARLEFCKLDPARYPCLCLAFDALRAGGTSTTILNAANEVAVENFLDEQIGFTDIPRVIEHTLESVAATEAVSLGVILAADRAARIAAGEYIAALTH